MAIVSRVACSVVRIFEGSIESFHEIPILLSEASARINDVDMDWPLIFNRKQIANMEHKYRVRLRVIC
ncbi:hypothetical protein [Candidatus Ichthyocystis sparus]|uniref:hypothetical protein n=1 Tax=Candidatus Ichthyocystis sparus TaxID=1561004 RepID=UPI00114655E5|nr:hypothetical protein [Candidatus Ichthyocystis sparus]